MSLRLQVANDFLHLVVRHERAVHAADAAAPGHVEHVALAEQLFGALLAQNGAAVDLGGDLERDAGREVRLDGAGDHVHRRTLRRQDDVNAGGARHLRQALDGALDVLAGDHHQVGHLVHDHHQIGQRVELELFLLVDRLAGFLVVAGVHRAGERLAFGLGFREARIVAVDVAHAELGHALVAFLHLAHRPFERDHRLLRIGDHRREQMRDAVIDREFEHLGIDHDQPALVGAQPVDQRQDHGVDGNRFAGAGGAGDQQMRHAREIDDHRLAADGLA